MERIKQATTGGATPPLSQSDIESLTGFMDVLIEMNFERQRNEKGATIDANTKTTDENKPLAS